jgi:hypothetical protein
MTSILKRRDFIKKTSTAGMVCCAIAFCPRLFAFNKLFEDDEIPDPKKLNYCGYVCPDDCPFLVASLEDDVEKKKEAFKNWEIEERYKLTFDPDIAYCFSCKNKVEPEGVVQENCTVRACALEKELNCCIECDELTTCDKALWSRYPEFHKHVIEMQKQYQGAEKG